MKNFHMPMGHKVLIHSHIFNTYTIESAGLSLTSVVFSLYDNPKTVHFLQLNTLANFVTMLKTFSRCLLFTILTD
jgi:hypothetical protein